jgi:methyl-accepting chemotaxis protein
VLKNMSIAAKVTGGFVIVLLLLAGLGVESILGLKAGSEGFATYRRWARNANLASNIEEQLFSARLAIREYAAGDAAGRESFAAAWKDMREHLALARERIKDPERVRLLGELARTSAEYEAAFARLAAAQDPAVRQGILEGELRPQGAAMLAGIVAIRESYMKSQDELGPRLEAENAASMRLTLIVGMAALLLGLALATVLSLSITRPLRKALAYAEAIARGDLDQSLDVEQKDETGRICAAMRDISRTVRDMKGELDGLVEKVSQGRLLERGNAGRFSGGFAQVIGGVNRLTDSLVGLIDGLPLPVMAIDRDYTVLFMNKAGLGAGDALREQVVGRKCHDFFRTSDCKTDKCACGRAMRSLRGESSSTDAHPAGKDLEINYMASPITDGAGNVVGAFEVVVDQTKIINAQRHMERIAERAQSISERMSSAAEELSAQVEQVSRGSELQRDRMTETATAMEQMNATVLEVARNASSAAENSGSARQQAEQGAGVVGEAVGAIAEVHTSAQELQENMGLLGQQAEAIGQVMNVISDIADQTNLLALNAAIEAARAGDAGRGFAVVADEVRKLAEKTVGATQEVGASIRAIQEAARRNVENMGRAVSSVDKATRLAGDSGQALTRIVDFVGDSAKQVEGIAAASEEQSAASEQINRAIEEVTRIVSETAEGMAQSSQAVQELAGMASELNQLIAELRTDGGGRAQ